MTPETKKLPPGEYVGVFFEDPNGLRALFSGAKNPEKWQRVEIPLGGPQHKQLGLRKLGLIRLLTPNEKAKSAIKIVSKEFETQLTPPDLDKANRYQQILNILGLGANKSYLNLTSGFYPIDLEYLGEVCEETSPSGILENNPYNYVDLVLLKIAE